MPHKRPTKESETITRIREELADFQPTLEAVRERGQELLDEVIAEVKKRPLKSMAVALGVGFIIATLFGRRRSS